MRRPCLAEESGGAHSPKWLRGQDSNLDEGIQSPSCCRLHHPAIPAKPLGRRSPCQRRPSHPIVASLGRVSTNGRIAVCAAGRNEGRVISLLLAHRVGGPDDGRVQPHKENPLPARQSPPCQTYGCENSEYRHDEEGEAHDAWHGGIPLGKRHQG